MRIQIELAGGGDERFSPSSTLYLRPLTDREEVDEPNAACMLRLRGVAFFIVETFAELTDELTEHLKIAKLTSPNGNPVHINAEAVVDWDDPPSTVHEDANSWLVFGTGPSAPRLAVQETRAQLIEYWAGLGLESDLFD